LICLPSSSSSSSFHTIQRRSNKLQSSSKHVLWNTPCALLCCFCSSWISFGIIMRLSQCPFLPSCMFCVWAPFVFLWWWEQSNESHRLTLYWLTDRILTWWHATDLISTAPYSRPVVHTLCRLTTPNIHHTSSLELVWVTDRPTKEGGKLRDNYTVCVST
jgi:hypothetical protein